MDKSGNFKITPSIRREIIKIVDERIREAHITREDFSELKNIVKELAEAQRRTEDGLTQLTLRVDQLTLRLDQLTARVDQLTVRLDQLTIRVDQLAEAQKRTEHALQLLIKEHERTREILAGISDTVGHGLEDKIFPYIYDFVKKEFGVEVEILDRRNVIYSDGRYDEVNIYVEGRKNGEKVFVVGECKSRPTNKEVDNFWGLVERLRRHFKVDVYPFIVGYSYSPQVENYLRDNYPEIKVLKSFEFELKYKPSKLEQTAH